MELVKKIVRVGNSAGVILPIEWRGGEARIELIKKPIDIEEDVLALLKPYLPEIIGVYIAGSYARGEQEKNSDADILAVSKNLQKEIFHGRYHIVIYPLEVIKKAIKENPLSVYPRLIEARAILNSALLDELKDMKIDSRKFQGFAEDTKGIIRINKETIELDKLDGRLSGSVVYSLILRLRGVFIIKCILGKKAYSNKIFKKWIGRAIGLDEAEASYDIYSSVRDNRKVKELLLIDSAEKLLKLLEGEVDLLKKKI